MLTLWPRRIQHKLTEWYYENRSRRGLPAQLPSEISFFKKAFSSVPGKPLRIFEWGSGNSTLFYAEYLKSLGRTFEWHAVENSDAWAKKMKEVVGARGFADQVHIHLKPFSAFFEKESFSWEKAGIEGFAPATEEEKAYVDFPQTLGIPFDVMIVDGRFRRRCLLAAASSVSPEGLVMLHDAERSHYHSSLTTYPHRYFFSSGKKAPGSLLDAKVWIGSPKNSELIRTLSSPTL